MWLGESRYVIIFFWATNLHFRYSIAREFSIARFCGESRRIITNPGLLPPDGIAPSPLVPGYANGKLGGDSPLHSESLAEFGPP